VSTADTIMPPSRRLAFRAILLATDLSPASQLAFRFASDIARRYNADLLITHKAPGMEREGGIFQRAVDEMDESLGWNLSESEDGQRRTIRPDILINHGSLAALLSESAAQRNVDLIVLASHGRTGLEKLSEGSKAEEIAYSVNLPVLTIGPKVSRVPECKRLLYLTDFSSTSAHAIPYAASLAGKYGASLDILHVNDPDTEETPRDVGEGMSRFVRDEIRNRGFGDVFGRVDLQFGQRTERIVEFAGDRKIDLIVMGQKHTSPIRARIASHLPGGAAYNVITRVHCAVLTVPNSVPKSTQ
jgi:nucleotide-binding universal stress UspA family protein